MTGLFHFFEAICIGKFAIDLIDSFMSHFTDTYEIVRRITPEGVDFFFVSFGEREVIKIV